MTTANKETIYDEQISPLMTQIIAICQQHGIAMLADFDISHPENDGLNCTTLIPDGIGKNPTLHSIAYRTLMNTPAVVALTITSPKAT